VIKPELALLTITDAPNGDMLPEVTAISRVEPAIDVHNPTI